MHVENPQQIPLLNTTQHYTDWPLALFVHRFHLKCINRCHFSMFSSLFLSIFVRIYDFLYLFLLVRSFQFCWRCKRLKSLSILHMHSNDVKWASDYNGLYLFLLCFPFFVIIVKLRLFAIFCCYNPFDFAHAVVIFSIK